MPKGRKKNSGIIPVREPNGRLLRSVETAIHARPPGEAKRLADAALRGMAAPEWGTELGRLYLAGKIGPKLYETGKRWTGMVRAYDRATGAPPAAPSTSAFAAGGGMQEPDVDSEEGKRRAKAERAIMAAMEEALAVLRCAGADKERAVRAVCERNEMPGSEVQLRAFVIGLGWLAQHWGVIDLRRAS